MARPVKCRRICALPRYTRFGPRCGGRRVGAVVLALDEYETIRLIDLEALSQEEAARQMQVARTTVQALYATARAKLAQAVCLGQELSIEGGAVSLCAHSCQKGCCRGREIG